MAQQANQTAATSINLTDKMRTRMSFAERQDLKYAMAVACVLHAFALYMFLPEWGTQEIEEREVLRVQMQSFRPPPPKAMPTPPPEKPKVKKKKKVNRVIPAPDPNEPDPPPEEEVEFTFDDVPDVDEFAMDVSEDFDFSMPAAQGLPGPAAPIAFGYTPPEIRNRQVPVYPPALREAGITGSVSLRVIIEEDGTVNPEEENIVVQKSTHEFFVQPAIDAAKLCTFAPPTDMSGKPARISYTITFEFNTQ